MSEIIIPNIEDSKIDKLTALSKGLLGMVPFAGSILSEIIGNIILTIRELIGLVNF